MIQNVVARRYSKALFELAKEQGALEQVTGDLLKISRSLEGEPRLEELMSHQRLSPGQKKKLALEIWQKAVSPLVMSFLLLLVDKHRERHLAAIVAMFMELLRSERNVAVAEIKTAYPLEPEEVERVQRALERALGKKLEMQVSVHPELIGGLVVKVGDRVLDGSVIKRLSLMKERLAERPIGKLEVGS